MDTKAPKENVVGWQESGLIHGEVLDIGCGLGDNAVYLAANGHAVTGLDISLTALITAERRANDAGVDVQFAVADATKLDGHRRLRHTVIDSGMYHCLDDGERSLRRRGAPGRPPRCHPAARRVLRRQRRTGSGVPVSEQMLR